jgi:L-alanine-DL-glutamate epimerase-like enolase superfamily enzyme
MKCGGPTPARFIHDYAHAAGLSLMLGCNDETRISIAAGVHLAQSMLGLQFADLDGHMDLASDPSSGGFDIVDGCLVLSDKSGLGIEIDW